MPLHAQTYTTISNGTYYLAHSSTNGITATTTFNAATCVWEYTVSGSDYTFSYTSGSTTYYLTYNYGLSIGTSSTTWTMDGSFRLYYSSYYAQNYLRYSTNKNNWTTSTKTNNAATITLTPQYPYVPPATATHITSLSQLTATGSFILDNDVSAAGYATINNFTGSLDGGHHTISGLTVPLFGTASSATVRNVVLTDVNISGTGNTGAIACTADGATRIYNCGIKDSTATISGTAYTGSIVGSLEDNARVINCYSFATITGGSTVGGIVGYNNYASTSSNLHSLVVNCMFYGNITGGTSVYPIYGGSNITNAGSTGINNYNYFRQEASITPTGYNCALACEERFLHRWEFYRGILNSNRALMAYYITGSVSDTALLAKWVLDYSDMHYPILKPWGKYSSAINRFEAPTVTYATNLDYDDDTPEQLAAKEATHFCGASMGTLSVTMSRGTGNGGSNSSQSITLPITDMDTIHANNRYDYCFRKVQLPYFNDYFTGNYGAKVVTGWKITNVTGDASTTYNTYLASYEDGTNGYNFADTLCIGKDLYATSGRVFAQGGYYFVPQGVTAITIEAYWGTAVYLSDPNYDKTYSTDYGTAYDCTVAGARPTTFNGQTVYTTLAAAVGAVPSGSTVYDNAIVLVGNCHYRAGNSAVFNTNYYRPFTIMSADLDGDDEPDNCLFYQHYNRQLTNPIRFDFLWQPGIGVAAKVYQSTSMPDVGIFFPKGWFEITETAIAHYYEFEYDDGSKSMAPLILNNGIFEQFLSARQADADATNYIILGGHTWMKEFCNGTHADGTNKTYHRPISVMGGEYKKFYLSGTFIAGATPVDDNAECYVNGGKFGEMAGAGQEQIGTTNGSYGNIIFKINHAIIDEFYGGGINRLKPVQGNITVTMNNSIVDKYCGGPKFGDMAPRKTVTTDATGSVFGTYYGAGNGGTSLYRKREEQNDTATNNNDFQEWINNNVYNRGVSTGNGIATGYDFEYFVYAGGNDAKQVARFYVHYASFDRAQTNTVTSTLTRCLVKQNYYGGGNLGAVTADAISTLDQTIVLGDAFGAGFSATIPSADVYSTTGIGYPTYNNNTGLFTSTTYPTPTPYTWSNDYGSTSSTLTQNATGNWIYTAASLSGLGTVSGNATITVKGEKNSHIFGSLYGGGNMSSVGGNTIVTVLGNTKVDHNVYGGGNAGETTGSTHVQIGGNQP